MKLPSVGGLVVKVYMTSNLYSFNVNGIIKNVSTVWLEWMISIRTVYMTSCLFREEPLKSSILYYLGEPV